MKKFALAARKVSEGGSGSADEGLTSSPKKGEKVKKPTDSDAATIREQKKQQFEDVILHFRNVELNVLFIDI